ncbi:FecR family protein [Thiohalorhabdus sp.]|uniref:FecR family protein n=1 Tax=Thiohalorhabdus sp. TaxID=3094134 RepID=UPI002FC2A59E
MLPRLSDFALAPFAGIAAGAAQQRRGRARRPTGLLAGVLALMALSLGGPAAAQTGEVVGRVISQVGEVAAITPDSDRRSLERRSKVHEGETVVTGESGRAQIRFKDKGLTDIKPDSRFTVRRYRAESAGDDRDSAVMELLEGGMRTLTGTVGGGEGQEYEVETPVASIGIRGTQYLLRLCRGDCGEVPDGLYGGVTEGRIGVANNSGERAFGGDRYFRVTSHSDRPEVMLKPPEGILTGTTVADRGEPEELTLASERPNPGSFLNAVAAAGRGLEVIELDQRFEGLERVNRFGRIEGVSTPPAAAFAGISGDPVLFDATGLGQAGAGDTVVARESGAVEELEAPNVLNGTFAMTALGAPVELEKNEELGATWGRWDAGDLSTSPSLNTGSDLHFAYSENLTAQDHLDELAGSANYTLTGSTTPTDDAGNSYAFSTVAMGVDFTGQVIDSALVSINGLVDNWTLSTASQPLSPEFDLELVTGASEQGHLIGHFVGPQAGGAVFSFKGNNAGNFYAGSGVLER